MAKELSKKGLAISPSVTLAITAKAKEMKAAGIDVVSFGAGEPDFNTPKNIQKEGIRAIEEGLTRYTPASGIKDLKEAICEKFKRDNNLDYTIENIVVSSGAKHSLFNSLMAILNEGEEVIVMKPFWVSYTELIKVSGGVPVLIDTKEENEFKVTIEDLNKALTDKTKAIILNSPSNPTGSIYTKEELQEIADWVVQNDLYVISDEIYEKLVYEGEHVSIASLGEEIKERTVVVNGMSKAYAMTGWRIGYVAANKDIAKIMSNMQSHTTSNPCSISQYASVEGLRGDQLAIAEMRGEFIKRRDYMVEKINSIDKVSCLKPKGAFYIMVNIEKVLGTTINGYKIEDSVSFAKYLLDEAKVAVIPGAGFGVDNYVRLSYATSMENIVEGLDRLEKALA